MFKKIASIFLAATMVAGTTAVVANAAESESAVSADSSSQVGADSSSEVGASKVVYFDVKSAGWDKVNGIGTTNPVYCHIFAYTDDGKTYTGWQSKGEKCKYDASTAIATYDISTGIKKGADGLETIDDTNKWVVMFSNKTGAETYTLLLNSSCWGDTVVADPNTMLENNVDSEKQSMKISWKNNKNLSSPICITSTGKIQGDTYAAGENAETVVSQFLVEYYGSKYCTDDNVKNAFNKLGADPAKTIELVGYKINERLKDGIITEQKIADEMLDAIIKQVCNLTGYDPNAAKQEANKGQQASKDDKKQDDISGAPTDNGGSSNNSSNGSSSNGTSTGNGSVSSGQETTIFCVFGGLMIAAAGTMFLARKKREE